MADALELTAIVLVATEPAHAAAMLGAAHRPWESVSESAPTFMTEQVDRCRHRAVSALGAQRNSEHEQHGRSMTIHDALDFAMRALAGETGPTGALDRRPTPTTHPTG